MAIAIITTEPAKPNLLLSFSVLLSTRLMATQFSCLPLILKLTHFTKIKVLQSLLKLHSVDKHRKLTQTSANLEFANKSLVQFASVHWVIVVLLLAFITAVCSNEVSSINQLFRENLSMLYAKKSHKK